MRSESNSLAGHEERNCSPFCIFIFFLILLHGVVEEGCLTFCGSVNYRHSLLLLFVTSALQFFPPPPLLNYCISLYVQSASMGASLIYTVQEKTDKGSHKAGEVLVMDMGYNIVKYI